MAYPTLPRRDSDYSGDCPIGGVTIDDLCGDEEVSMHGLLGKITYTAMPVGKLVLGFASESPAP